MMPKLSEALGFYSAASLYMHDAGLTSEIEWQRNSSFEHFSESDLLQESAWVILCSGFRESIVRKHFDHISLCFCDWESAQSIAANANACRISAHSVFRNGAKLDAIVSVAETIVKTGFEEFKKSILLDPLAKLQSLPFIGPVTALHLVKNLGLDVAKPDRHLVRIASQFGFHDAYQLCAAIGDRIGESAKVVDLILWRYAADNQSIGLPGSTAKLQLQ
jgi:hypothetical protein